MRAPGDIVLVSCYEPGYQPIALASPAAFLRAAGYAGQFTPLEEGVRRYVQDHLAAADRYV